MSSNDHDFIDPNDPLYYAPRALRDRVEDSQTIATEDRFNRDTPSRSDDMSPRYVGRHEMPRRDRSDVFANAVAQALEESRQAGLVEVPTILRRRSSHLRGVVISLSIAAIATIAVIVFFVVPSSHDPGQSDGFMASISSITQSLKASLFPAPPRRVAPTLVVQDSSGIVNEPLKLGVNVTSPPADASVTIKGLPAGSRLTAGKRMGIDEWRVPANEIANTSVIPPDEFVGQASLTAELRSTDGATLVRGAMRLAWTPVWRPAATTVNVEATAPPQREDSIRAITPREIAGFISRGNQLLESGDLQAARLLFRRAADAHDPRAALALGKTYDPLFLRQFGAGGPAAEPEQARHWYQKSKEWGDASAQTQLDALAAAGH